MIKKTQIENTYAKNFNQMVDALKAERQALSKKQSYYDRIEQQILHAFELMTLTDDELLKLAKALKKLREERRENKIKVSNILSVISKLPI